MGRAPIPEQIENSAYLTKEALKRAVRKGIKQAATIAMKTAGSVVTTDGEWLVRYYQDGRVDKLRKLDRTSLRDLERKLNKLTGK